MAEGVKELQGLEYLLVGPRGTEPSPSHPYWISLGFGSARCCCRRRRRWRVWSRWCNPPQRAGTAPLRFYLSLWRTCCPACSTCTKPAAEGERTGGRKGRAAPCPQSCPPQAVQRCCCCSLPAPDAQAGSGHTGDTWGLLGTPAQRWQCLGWEGDTGRRMMLISSTQHSTSVEPLRETFTLLKLR